MRSTFITLACLIMATNVFAGEGVLKGKVADGKTQEELIGVTVRIKELPSNGDCLIEADNREDNFANRPQSRPTLSNLTLIGNNDTNAQKRGIRLRAGTAVKLYNVLVTGKPNTVTVATAETEASFQDGTSVIEHLWASKAFVYESISDLALETKTGNAINQTISFTNGYVGTIAGGKDLFADDNFFTSTNYKGAVPTDNDWTAGWTRK